MEKNYKTPTYFDKYDKIIMKHLTPDFGNEICWKRLGVTYVKNSLQIFDGGFYVKDKYNIICSYGIFETINKRFYVLVFCSAKAHRGKGLGKYNMKSILQYANDMGYNSVFLNDYLR